MASWLLRLVRMVFPDAGEYQTDSMGEAYGPAQWVQLYGADPKYCHFRLLHPRSGLPFRVVIITVLLSGLLAALIVLGSSLVQPDWIAGVKEQAWVPSGLAPNLNYSVEVKVRRGGEVKIETLTSGSRDIAYFVNGRYPEMAVPTSFSVCQHPERVQNENCLANHSDVFWLESGDTVYVLVGFHGVDSPHEVTIKISIEGSEELVIKRQN